MIGQALREALMLASAAFSGSLEQPRMAHTPVVKPQVTASQSHVGFDTNVYPGDKAMDAWKRSGEYEWVGYYLEAPCHKDASWSGTRARLTKSAWGLAVIYVGQQTWGKDLSAPARTTSSDDCSAASVGAAQGRIDARDAIAASAREGFEKGTVVFLDVERMDRVPQAMRNYYSAWVRTLLADGRYRPGIYTHTDNAATIYDDVSDEYANARVKGDPPFWVAGTRGFSADRHPTGVGHSFASVWQGALDVVRTHNGVKLPVDINVASVASPSTSDVAE